MNAKIYGEADNDSIYNAGSTVTAYGGDGNDTIINDNKMKPLIYGDGGNDLISLMGSSSSSVYGGAGNDSIYHGGSNSSVYGEAGDDVISIIGGIYTAKVSISGGTGNDTIYGNSSHHTMISGSGVDFIQYNSGDGNDVIYNFESVDTLRIGNGSTDTFSSLKSGSNVVVSVGNGKITLLGAANLDTLNILGTEVNPLLIRLNDNANTYNNAVEGATILALGGDDKIKTSLAANVSIDGGTGNDSLYGVGVGVTLNGGVGNDTLENLDNVASKGGMLLGGEGADYIKNNGNESFVDGGADNDTIYNYAGKSTVLGGAGNYTIDNRSTTTSKIDGGADDDFIKSTANAATIFGGTGNDTINNNKGGSNASIDGGDGNDYIKNISYNSSVTMVGGAGNDTIISPGLNAQLIGGKGNDYISLSGSNNLIEYVEGDGNDSIVGFNATSSLKIGNGTTDTYIAETVGSDIVVTVGNGKITLAGAANLSTVNILGKDNTIREIIGTSGADNLTNSSNSATVYSTRDEVLFTISGISTAAKVEDFTISGTTITIAKGALGTEEVSIDSADYTLKLASNVPTTPTTTSAKWSTLVNGKATYTAKAYSEYYTLDDNTIIYNEATGGETFTLNGIKSIAASAVVIDEEEKIVTLNAAALNAKAVILDSEDFSLELGADVIQDGGADEPKFISYANGTATYKIFGDKAYYTLDGNEIIYTAATADRQFTISGLATDLTLESGELDGVSAVVDEESGVTFVLSETALKNSNVTLSGTGAKLELDEDVRTTAVNYHAAVAGSVQVSLSGLSATAENDDGEIDGLEVNGKTLTISKEAAGKNLAVKSNAGNLAIKLASNVENISLTGTSGADTLNIVGEDITVIGGKGNDSINMTGSGVIQYASGDGNDTINYSDAYDLKITSGTISQGTVRGNDVIIPIGSNTLTIKDGKGNPINIIDANGNEQELVVDYLYYNDDKTAVTLSANYTGTLQAADYDSKVRTIDASAVTTAIEINGNNNANLIVGNANKNNTLKGGAGNDTLKGGAIMTGAAGSDVFVYEKGAVTITDYTANADKISLSGKNLSNASDVAISGKNIILGFGSDSLTITNGKDKKVAFVNGKTTTQYIFGEDVIFNAGKTAATLISSATNFNASNYTSMVTIDATKTKSATNIISNTTANKIYAGAKGSTLNGGKGNDTLVGGAGVDVFVYGKNTGNDVIQNYTSGTDKISIGSASISAFSINNAGDAVLKIGSNTLTLKKVGNENISTNGKRVTLIDANGKETTRTYYKDKIVEGSSVTLTSAFKSKSYTAGTGIVTVDAAQVTTALALNGNELANVLTSGKGTDTLKGGAGNDNLIGSAGDDKILGGAGADTLNGGAGNDSLNGEAGNDTLIGGEGKDTLLGGDGNDSLTGDAGNDKLSGNAGNDTLSGGAGNDNLAGNDGDDVIKGDAGNDNLNGGNGADTLYGGAGNDTFTGGAGVDLSVYQSGNDLITDYTSDDKISLSSAFSQASVKGANVVLKFGSNTLTLKNAKSKELTWLDSSGKEHSTIVGALKYTDSSKAAVTLPSYAEYADASARTQPIKIVGNTLSNTILGGAGADTIYGGVGNDSFKGGAGADTFIYAKGDGKDTIFDFDNNDMLKITGLKGAVTGSLNSDGDALTIKVGKTAVAVLEDFTATSFNINGTALSAFQLVDRLRGS